MQAHNGQEKCERAGPIELTDRDVRVVYGDRVVFSRPRDRIRCIEVVQRPLWAHPAVAILIAGVVILPFSSAMLVLMFLDDKRAFVTTLVIGLGTAAVVSAVVLWVLARLRRRHGDWRVVVRTADRRYAFAIKTDDCEAVRQLAEHAVRRDRVTQPS